MIWRVPVTLAGLACLGFGVAQLLFGGSATDPVASIPWLVGVLVVHDAVAAPLVFAVGALLSGAIRHRRARRVVAGGLAVGGVLVLVALPPLLTPGVPGNPTATPRDYLGGLLILLGIDLVVTALLAVLSTAFERRCH